MKKDFFQVITVEELIRLFKLFAPVEDREDSSLLEAKGSILADDFVAQEELPAFNRSCMDGYALKASDTFGASEFNPVYLESAGEIEIDKLPEFQLEQDQCAGIVTGAGLPQGADSVVMYEYTQHLSGQTIEIRKSVAPGEHVMLKGEDVQAGQKVFCRGQTLRPQEIGLLAALGKSRVSVFRKPVIGLLSTGDELVPVDQDPEPGQIRDVNSYTLAVQAEQSGAKCIPYGIVADQAEEMHSCLQQALQQCDLVLLSGGSSVGTRDLALSVLQEFEQSEILAHGVAISPGKPTILARVGTKPVLCLPGQVTSAQVVMFVLGVPFIRHLAGALDPFSWLLRPRLEAELARNIASRQGREDYVRVELEERKGQLPLAVPVLGKSGLLGSMLKAQGLVCIPQADEGLKGGSTVKVWLFD